MGFYDRVVLPRLLSFAMKQRDFVPFRRRIGQSARGRVLEIGIGPGFNLPFYGPAVDSVTGVDPSAELLAMASGRAAETGRNVTLVKGSSEGLAFEDRSFDTVVTTWTLCSIPQADRALAEARRVLKPGGELLFVEHGRSPEPGVARWQDRITPVWKHATGGCHLNRDIEGLVRGAGFTIADLRNLYMRGPKIATYIYEGRAN